MTAGGPAPSGTIEVTDWSGYRREARSPHGFSHYLAELDGAQA